MTNESDVPVGVVDRWLAQADGHPVPLQAVWRKCRFAGLEHPAQVRRLAIGLIAELLHDGLMTAGTQDGTPWERTAGTAIERIAERWRTWNEEVPGLGDVVWLTSTSKGRERGRGVRGRGEAHDRSGTVDNLLAEASYASIYAADVWWEAKEADLSDSSQARRLLLGTISDLLVGGAIVVGDQIDGAFVAWAGSTADTLDRLLAQNQIWSDAALQTSTIAVSAPNDRPPSP